MSFRAGLDCGRAKGRDRHTEKRIRNDAPDIGTPIHGRGRVRFILSFAGRNLPLSAGLLTRSGRDAFPTALGGSGINRRDRVPHSAERTSQQRDCSGFAPDSLLIRNRRNITAVSETDVRKDTTNPLMVHRIRRKKCFLLYIRYFQVIISLRTL